jgi:hypothetical protein
MQTDEELVARTIDVMEELLAERNKRIKSLKSKLKKLRATLQEKDDEIRELERTIDELPGGWNTPSVEEDIPSLPLPRMEFRWYPFYSERAGCDTWSRYRVISSLVYRDLYDKIIAVPFGNTVSSGHSSDDVKPWDRRRPLPSRDGAMALFTAAHPNVPLYAVPPEGKPWRLDRDCVLAEDYKWQLESGAGARRGVDSEGQV